MIEQICFKTVEEDGRLQDIAVVWIGGMSFSRNLTPEMEKSIVRLAVQAGVKVDERRTSRRGYRVEWSIDIVADSPREAAQKAREIQLRAESRATVFDVIEHDSNDEGHTIDLLDDHEEIV